MITEFSALFSQYILEAMGVSIKSVIVSTILLISENHGYSCWLLSDCNKDSVTQMKNIRKVQGEVLVGVVWATDIKQSQLQAGVIEGRKNSAAYDHRWSQNIWETVGRVSARRTAEDIYVGKELLPS